MAVGLSDLLCWGGGKGAASTSAYVAPTPDCAGCMLLFAAYSPVTDEFGVRGADTVLGAGRLWTGSINLPELASSLAFRLPTNCWEGLAPLAMSFCVSLQAPLASSSSGP